MRFYAAEKLWYTPFSTYLDVDWSDLYINVMDQATPGDAKTIYCASSYWSRADYPPPYNGFQIDDNSPASFYYTNTPAWAESDFRSYSAFSWTSTYAVSFDNRGFGRDYPDQYCTHNFYFSGMAGAAVYYLNGFYEFERDPGGV